MFILHCASQIMYLVLIALVCSWYLFKAASNFIFQVTLRELDS